MKLSRLARPLMYLLIPCVVSACSLLQNIGNARSLDEGAIAQNLLYTLSMLDEVSPWQTAVQFSEPGTNFGRYVESGLGELGYAVRRVSADQGKHYVRYASEQLQNETGKFTRYRVAIGDVSVERYYDKTGVETYPVSVMSIEGAKVQEIGLNDEIFSKRDNFYSAASFIRDDGSEVQVVGVSPSTANTSAIMSNNGVTLATAARLDPSEKKNMYETRESNFSAVFVDYEDVKREILIFPNDSLFLGQENKAVIEQYANSIESNTDVISLIGCSHGKTRLTNGNSLLAIGRANRVKEALLSVGVSEEQVLDEGCWAPVHFDEMMPRRGVVMTLKRPKA